MRLEELGRRQLERYPMPIATEWAQVIKPQQSVSSRHRHFHSLIDVVLRYCALIMLNDYQLDSRQLVLSLENEQRVELQRTMADIEEILADVEVAKSLRLTRDLARIYWEAERPDLLFVPELLDGFWDKAGDATPLQLDWKRLLDRFDSAVGMREKAYDQYYQRQDPLLASILARLDFLCDYPLVWINRTARGTDEIGSDCVVQELMGPSWDQAARRRWTEASWENDRLFLGNQTQTSFLQLHPFIMLGHCSECEREGLTPPYEVFLYDRTTGRDGARSKEIWIGHLRGHRHEEPSGLIEGVISAFKEALVEALRADEDRLISWDPARQNARDFARDQVENLTGKYDADVYFPRTTIEAQINRFLDEDDSTGFVVVGDSGVGKTNLLCDLTNRRVQDHTNDIVLFFNCADFSREDDPESLVAVGLLLEDTLSLTKALRGLDGERPANARMLLVFDAINEHDDPASFLKAINHRLVRKYHHYPWLKVVVSCRSELWGLLQLERFASRHWFYQVGDQMGVRLAIFSPEELRRAYKENYRKKYGLRTSYEDLSDQAKRFMRDPLMLLFVAKAYEGQEVPDDVGSLRVFRRYVDEKIGSVSDEKIVVDRLVKMMYQSAEDALGVADMWQDSEIGEWVMAPRRPSDPMAHRSPYVRLLDEGVIYETSTLEGLFAKPQVRFTHDRLFEYLLAEVVLPAVPRSEDILRLIEESHDYSSLWGALEAGLSMRFDTDLLTELARLDNSEVRGLLLDVLSLISQDSRQEVSRFLSDLLDEDHRNRSLLATMAACEIGDTEVLREAIYSDDEYTHAMGVQYAYYLWERDSIVGEELIGGIASEIAGLRPIKALRSYLELSGYLATHLMGELELVRPFLHLWRDILRRLGSTPALLQKPVVRWGTKFLISGFKARGGDEEGGLMNYDALTKFFDLPRNTRKEVAGVAAYIDPELPASDEVMDTIVSLAKTSDAMVGFMLTPLLVGRCLRDRGQGLRLIDRIFGTGVPIAQYTAQKALAVLITPMAADAASGPVDPELDELIRQLEDYQMRTWVDPECTITIRGRTYNLGIGHVFYPMMFEAIRYPGETRVLDKFINTPSPLVSFEIPGVEPETAMAVYMMNGLAGIGMLGSEKYVRAVLPVLGRWMDRLEPEVQECLAKSLALLHSRAPQLVQAQLNRWAEDGTRAELVKDLRIEIRRNPPVESAGTRLSRSGLMAMQSFPFLEGAPPYIAAAVSQIAAEAEDFAHAMRIIVNTILDAAQPRAEDLRLPETD